MNRKQKIVPGIYASQLISLLAELGIDPDRVLAQTELSLTILQDPRVLMRMPTTEISKKFNREKE